MKNQLFSKTSEGVIALELLTVPAIPVDQLPASHVDWVRRQVASASGPLMDPDDYAAMHPAYARVVGFGYAVLRHSEAGVDIVHYALDTCDETGALDLAHDLMRQCKGTTVSYGHAQYAAKMLVARTRLAGMSSRKVVRDFMDRHVDLADLLTLRGLFAVPPLGHAMDLLGLRSERHRPTARQLYEAYDRGDDEMLDRELRHRLNDIVRVYARVGVSPEACVNGSVVDGCVAASSSVGAQKAAA